MFINNFIDRRQVERLKDAGLNVFDMGEMRGLETLLPNIRQLAAVLDVPERGQELADDLLSELEAALFSGHTIKNFDNWKKEFKHQVRPRLFAGLRRRQRHRRATGLPGLNPAVS